MRHRNEMLCWAQKWHYPFLSMPDGRHIKHGLASWKRFVGARNQKRILLASRQIAKWNAWAQQDEQSA